MRLIFKIKRYIVYLQRQTFLYRNPEYDGSPKYIRTYATITCLEDITVNKLKLNFFFLRPDSDEVANYYEEDSKNGYVYLPENQYVWYLDLLRNEGPILGVIDDSDLQTMGIKSSDEPIGAGELDNDE